MGTEVSENTVPRNPPPFPDPRNPPPFPDFGFPKDGTPSSYDLNLRILVAAVFSLAFVVALVVILHLYARFVLRRRRSRRWTTVAIFRSTALPTDPPRAGLDPAAIARIPKHAYKPSSEEPPAECSICLSVAGEGEVVRVLPSCKHVFHVDCIDMWLHSHATCPVCRASAEPLASVELRLEAGEASGGVPPLELGGVGDGEGTSGAKEGSSVSRLSSSFRRMLSRERSTRTVQADGVEDLESQQ